MTQVTENGITTITASEGNIFRRIHDGFEMSEIIVLGIDHSTGTLRPDLPDYYEEIPAPDYESNAQEILDIILGNDE